MPFGKELFSSDIRDWGYSFKQDEPYACLFSRLFQLDNEADAMVYFEQYAQQLRPFYESLCQPLSLEELQQLSDCIRSYPGWSPAHIAVEFGRREIFRHNHILRQGSTLSAGGPCSEGAWEGRLGCIGVSLLCCGSWLVGFSLLLQGLQRWCLK